MPVASVFLFQRPCYNCMPIGTVEWRVGISSRLKLRSMIETGDSHATNSQGMDCFRVFVPVCVSHHCCVTADCYSSITFFSA